MYSLSTQYDLLCTFISPILKNSICSCYNVANTDAYADIGADTDSGWSISYIMDEHTVPKLTFVHKDGAVGWEGVVFER